MKNVVSFVGEKAKNAKEFVKEHKKEAVLTLIGAVGLIGVAVISKRCSDNLDDEIKEVKSDLLDCSDELDLGRDCVLRCFDQDTNEQIDGEVECCESFWNDLMDMSNLD